MNSRLLSILILDKISLRPVILLVLCVLVSLANAQEKDEFQSPLGIPLTLAGTFGELRNNHFHAGLDLKTNTKSGYRIYSVADGFVSRIKVQPGGYGNALYITHPNGYTSVYGHLQEFKGAIAEYVQAQQYAQQSFGVDLYLSPGQISVSRGQVVALSGNSGSSSAPHLHFELRKTATQRPVNPLKFYYVKDDIKPTIEGLKVYGLTDGFYQTTGKKYPVKYISTGVYRLATDTVYTEDPITGISVRAIDKLNGAGNRNGFYELKMYADDVLHYHFSKDEIGFDESLYLNCHTDYPEKKRNGGSYYTNCFKLKGNRLSVYKSGYDDGKLYLGTYSSRKIRVEISDFAGNTSVLSFVLKYRPERNVTKVVQAYDARFLPSQPNYFSANGVSVSLPAGAVYDHVHFVYHKVAKPSSISQPAYSDMHSLHSSYIPLHKSMTVAIVAKDFPENLRSKAVMAILSDKNRLSVRTGHWAGNDFTATNGSFGKYFITVDTTSPTVSVYRAPKGNSYVGRDYLRCKIRDDLSGIKSFRATVNGQWILMNYDRKSATLSHKFDGRIPKGSNKLKVIVKDYVGNEKVLDYTFTR